MKDYIKTPKSCEWTRERTASLINLYQSHECLWNNYIEAYKNKDKRVKAIDTICNQLQISKADFGKKIHNLRNQFNAEMKKLDKRNESSTEVYRSRWEHYDALRFLREVIAPRPGYSNHTLKGHRKFEIKYSMVEDEEQQQSNEVQETTEEDIQYEEQTESDRNPLEFTSIPVVSREEILESKYRRPSVDEIETHEYIQTVQHSRQQNIHPHLRQSSQELIQIEDPRTVHPETTTTIVGVETIPPKKRPRTDTNEERQRDQWDVFGEFVAAEFRNLNTEMSRKKLKRKIMQVMLDVGQEDDGININISLN